MLQVPRWLHLQGILVRLSKPVSYWSNDNKFLRAWGQYFREIWWNNRYMRSKTSSSVCPSFWLVNINWYLHMNSDTKKKKKVDPKLACHWTIADGFRDCISDNAFHLSTPTAYLPLKHDSLILLGLQTETGMLLVPNSCTVAHRFCIHRQISIYRDYLSSNLCPS